MTFYSIPKTLPTFTMFSRWDQDTSNLVLVYDSMKITDFDCPSRRTIKTGEVKLKKVFKPGVKRII